MARICPRCSTYLAERMVTNDRFAITADDCKNCGGLFLDRGELARLAPDSAAVEELASQLPREPEEGLHDIKCPHCTSQMHVSSVTELGLQLDICGGCKGFWFDRHELETLRRAGGKAETTKAANAGSGYDSFGLLGDILVSLASAL